MKPDRPECDIEKTQIMAQLLTVEQNLRDQNWNQNFLSTVQTASFSAIDAQSMKGPDGFPYFGLRIPEAGKPFTSYCIRNMKEDFLLDNGYGVTINPTDNAADWVFSYGDIVNLHLNGVFYSQIEPVAVEREITLKKNEEILVAQPSESYLPVKARAIIKKYLQFYGVKEPKTMLIARKANGKMIQELAFNIFKEEVAHPENLDSFMRQLSWFLPRHYILVLVSKNSDLVNHFENL